MTTKTPPKLLTRDEILASTDRDFEYVDNVWGGTVKVIALTGTERGQYEASLSRVVPDGERGLMMQPGDVAIGKVRLVSLSIVDEDNKRLFSEVDILALGDTSADPIERVYDVAARLSRFTKRDLEVLKNGLKADQNGSSGSV